MARMIPEYFSPDNPSNGEKQIFEYFRNDDASDDWYVLHSLNLGRHVKRLYGEIDFLVLAPGLGVFSLEVKTGGVIRTKGEWQYIDRWNVSHRATKSPFDQAKDGMYSIKNALKERFGSNSRHYRVLMEAGVMFPSIEFDNYGTEFTQWQVYDKKAKRRPISDFIKQMAKKTHEKLVRTNARWYDQKLSIPNKKIIKELLDFLRGDFYHIPKTSQKIDDYQDMIERYTDEQFVALEQMRYNKRCLFRGAAGTGKTNLAIESARIGLAENKKVLLICYNQLLADWLAEQFDKNDHKITVASYYQFLLDIAGIEDFPVDAGIEYFENELPLKAYDMLQKEPFEAYDKLIIDEGQDLITIDELEMLNEVLKGGISTGEWRMFCDLERQNIFTDDSAEEKIELLESMASFSTYNLVTNCRNTKSICDALAKVSGFSAPSHLKVEVYGPNVEYKYYRNENDALKKLDIMISFLLKDGILPEQITVLSPNRFQNSLASKIKSEKYDIIDLNGGEEPNIKNDNEQKESNHKQKIDFSTIQRFKGLENVHIIILDVYEIDSEWIRKRLYVGMSRATFGLHMLLDDKLKNDFDRF